MEPRCAGRANECAQAGWNCLRRCHDEYRNRGQDEANHDVRHTNGAGANCADTRTGTESDAPKVDGNRRGSSLADISVRVGAAMQLREVRRGGRCGETD